MRPGVGGSEHPGWAIHPTQGQEGSQEGGSGVVPAGPAGQGDRRSGKGSRHCANSVCTAGRILENVRGSEDRGKKHRDWQESLREGGVGGGVLVSD